MEVCYKGELTIFPGRGKGRKGCPHNEQVQCSPCKRIVKALSHRAFAKRRYNARHAFLDWLKSVPCFDCHICWPSYVMEFDHRPGTVKVFCIGNWTTTARSLSSLQEEVQKCDLLCANCHRMRTWGERRVRQ